MKVSHDAVAGTVIISLLVGGGVWYAQDPECQQWVLSCLSAGPNRNDAGMSQVTINDIDWSADGQRLLARFRCANDAVSRLVLLNVAEPASRFDFDAMGELLSCASLAPDSQHILVASWKDHLWWLSTDELEMATPLVELPFRELFTTTAIAPDGRLIAAGTNQGRICLCDPISRSYTNLQAPDRSTFRSLQFARDGKRMLSAQISGRIILWDVAAGEILQEFAGHHDGTAAAEFLCDGRRIISGGLDDTVRIWDIDSGREMWRGEFGLYGVQALALSTDGKTAAWGGFNHKIIVWDLELQKKKLEIAISATCIHALQFSPDGTTLAAAGREGSIRLYDAQTGAETGRIEVVAPASL